MAVSRPAYQHAILGGFPTLRARAPARHPTTGADPIPHLGRHLAAAEKGVRAIHGEAPFIEVRPGRSYKVELRASGGLSIRAE